DQSKSEVVKQYWTKRELENKIDIEETQQKTYEFKAIFYEKQSQKSSKKGLTLNKMKRTERCLGKETDHLMILKQKQVPITILIMWRAG
ncbi:12790_t:CDS:2, partial [Funneliformis geosporum]